MAHQSGMTPISTLRSNNKRADYAIMMIWIVMTLDILGFGSSLLQYNLLKDISRGEEIPAFTAQLNDLREKIIRFLQSVALISAGILFIRWFRRSYYNLHQKADNLSFSEGWAAGAWFVPLLNLGRPYHIMQELYIESKRLLDTEEVEVPTSLHSRKVGIWWTIWILNNLASYLPYTFVGIPKDLNDYLVVTSLNMVANLFGIPAAIAAVQVIRTYARVEPLLNGINGDEPILYSIPEEAVPVWSSGINDPD
ncbi:MAG: DUF4328 domain-containing protein [Sphingobacteriales bacterium]|nr:MAG: DUF4328 domain-containing protein [Sphingobacteriales bacterium]